MVIFSIGVVFSGIIKRQMRCCVSCSLSVRKGSDYTLLNLLLFFFYFTHFIRVTGFQYSSILSSQYPNLRMNV